MTAFEIAESYEQVMGSPPAYRALLWVGATTHETATVVVRTDTPVASLELTLDDGVNAPWQTSALATDADRVARFDLTGLAADTRYTYALPNGQSGEFRTHPAAAGTPCSFSIAFGGDQDAGTSHPVFDEIRSHDPLMWFQIGDWGYPNPTENDPKHWHANYDANLRAPSQARLYSRVASQHVWDDHEGAGGNDTNGSAVAWPACAAAYRSREPHYPLPHARAAYQAVRIGRVLFIFTDQRSEASPNSATDNASKSMLGATQKAWFKNLIATEPGPIVWICPRWFANANHTDSWNNFSTERAELCDWIKLYAHVRVQVWGADKHSGGIDDGTNVDHATVGGEPLPTFQAAPLDRAPTALSGTYSHGEFNGNGQFGLVRFTDTGGATIEVEWELRNSTGSVLTSYTFVVAV
jgi:hypothetical protein